MRNVVPGGGHTTQMYDRKALPMSLARRLWHQQQVHLYARFAEAFPPNPDWRVLNLGEDGEPRTAFDCCFEDMYPYRSRITAVGLEEGRSFRQRFADVEWVQVRRGAALPFPNDAFDLVYCSAVIEHVGSRAEQRAFLDELLRVAPRAYVTTPNRWYPIELHTILPFLHWLPAPTYQTILRRTGFTFFAEERNLNLLDRRSLLDLVPAGATSRLVSHRFLGLTSNLLLSLERAAR
jgi:hypothetical protein